MGMAASQARFLSLTARKTNVEWEGQQVNQQRTALANESANLYNQLTAIKVPTPPAVSDYTTTTYTFTTGDLKETSGKGSTTFSFENINNIAGQNYVTLSYTKYFWDEAINKMNSGDILIDGDKKRITLTNGLSTFATEYEAKPNKVKLSEFDKSVFETEDGTPKEEVTIGGLQFTFNGTDKITRTVGGSEFSYDVKKLSNGNYQVTISDKDSNINEVDDKYSFNFGGNSFEVQVNKDGSYTILNFSEASAIAKYYSKTGSGTFSNDYFGDDFTTVTTATGKLYNQPILSYTLDDDNQVYYISASENATATETSPGYFSASYYIAEISKLETVEYPCSFSTAENGRYKTITINNASGDAETFDLGVSSVEDEAAYHQAMLDYEYEQAKYEKKIKDINAKTEKIQQEDRTLELRLKQLDTEQNALKTEMDAVKKVIEDNVEATFKTFA